MARPSLLLVHGAATGAWIWRHWRRELGALGWQANVLDLRGHGRSLPIDLSAVTLEDYAADVASVTAQIAAAQGLHPVVVGWSMGGLVAMMYAREHAQCPALVLLDPIAPGELRKAGIDTVRRFAGAVLTPESFGIYPADRERSRTALFDLDDGELEAYLALAGGGEESGVAFRQALRGVSIPAGSIACPVLLVSPEAEAENAEANRRLAEHLGGEVLGVPGMGHWGIVWHEAAVSEAAPVVDAWLRRQVGPLDGADARQEGEG